MSKKIIINPLTRISGFLEIEVEVENNSIIDAKSSGMLFRGFEEMLRGRSPLDAVYFTQRICGICSTAHSMASSLALEDALKVNPEKNDEILRDILHGCEFLQNHLRHFYQYTLPDFVKGPEINPISDTSHNDFRIPDNLNNKIAEDYIKSVKYSRMAHEMLAVLGGKAPHNHGVFVGGVTVNIDSYKLIKVKSLLEAIHDFIINNMVEDVHIIAKYYPEYFRNGIGYKNLLSYGVYDKYEEKDLTYVMPGILLNGRRQEFDPSRIREGIYHAWYVSQSETNKPNQGDIKPDRDKEEGYSWVKAPRYKGYSMEVGPLARMILSGEYTRGISTMDRTIARVLEAQKISEIMKGLIRKVELKPANQKIYDIPNKSTGEGLIDTTRGALGHWINIENQSIKNYDIITPTSWNLSPMDAKGKKGVVEKALIGTEIEDINNPIEIGRIVRSFDPCVSCATHVFSNKKSLVELRLV